MQREVFKYSLRESLLLALAIVVAVVSVPRDLSAQSQDTLRITGIVSDATDGQPVAGATVRLYVRTPSPDGLTWLEPTPFGAIAGPNGRFDIRAIVDSGDVFLQISSVGYATAQIAYSFAPVEARLQPTSLVAPTITVSGVRRSRSVEDACCRVESIREEVQQHAPFTRGVDRILRRYSSCTSTRVSCSIDGASSVRLRGLEPTSTRVLLDGAPVLGGLSTYYGLAMIPAQALQTIRIVEGASDARYGNGAVSGAIDLQIRPPTEEAEGHASLVLSGPAMPSQHVVAGASWTGMIDDVGLAAFTSATLNRRIDDASSETDGSRVNGLARGNVLLDDATELIVTLGAGVEARNGGVPATEGTSVPFRETLDLGRADVGVQISRVISNDLVVDVAFHGSRFTLDGSIGGSPRDASQTTGYTRATGSFETGPIVLNGGLEYFAERLRDEVLGDINYDVAIASAFVQNQWNVFDQWTVLTGVRFDHHNLTGDVVNPRGAIRWSPVEKLAMRVMVGTGFKGEALFTEDHRTLMRTIAWRSNPSFEAERSLTFNYDVSYDISLGESVYLQSNLNAYSTLLTDVGIPDPDSLESNVYFPINAPDRRRLRGVELQTRWTFGTAWSSSFAISAVDYHTMLANGDNQRVPLAPGINIDAAVMFVDDASGITAEAWGSLIGSQRLPTNPWGLYDSPSYALLNARLEKKFGSVTLVSGVLNALDEQQSDHTPLTFEVDSGRLDGSVVWGSVEGREFFLGLQWNLGTPSLDPSPDRE